MKTNPFSLQNKQILITGASSGIGRATAIACAHMGASIAITGRDEKRLYQTMDTLEHSGHTLIPADLTVEEEVEKLVDCIDKLDGVVHCAGINHRLPIYGLSQKVILHIMQTNFMASALLSRYLLKYKKLKKESSIVHVSSISTDYPAIGNAAYCASKGALRSFSRVMALEVSPMGIRVNCIEPGMIATEWLSKNPLTEEQFQTLISAYPFKRLGTPEEVACVAVFLLSDATKWMTGSTIKLDGGLTLT